MFINLIKFCTIRKTIGDPPGTAAPEDPPKGEKTQNEYAHAFIGLGTNLFEISKRIVKGFFEIG